MTPYAFYQSVTDQSRQPVFFADWGVPDTMSGRFDMLIAHAILVFRRLKRIEGDHAEEARARSQAFSDLLFKDLDRALRDTGVSDRKVPKRLKMLATAYLGRGQAFGEALDAGDQAALADALERNAGGIVFAVDGVETADSDEPVADLLSAKIAAYLQQADAHLNAQDDDTVLSGTLDWPHVPDAQAA
ncbi:MAG: ubiquinol-cytochrome C chaperone family protein [Devosiaceae bacterium]